MARKSKRKLRFFSIVVCSFLIVILFLFSSMSPVILDSSLPHVYAMGQAPTTCGGNEYYSNYTSFWVNNGTENINVMAKNGTHFIALTSEGYNVSFILHTANESSQGNTASNGSVWFLENIYGFEDGHCVGFESNPNFSYYDGQSGYIGPDENVSVSQHVFVDQLYDPYYDSGAQSYEWASWTNIMTGPNYTVTWLEPTTMNLNCEANNGVANCTSVVTANPVSHFEPPNYITGIYGPAMGNVTFSSNGSPSSSNVGKCTLAGSGNVSSCSVTFNVPTSRSSNITASYLGDIGHERAVAWNTVVSSSSSSTTTTVSHGATTTMTSSSPTTTGPSPIQSVSSTTSSNPPTGNSGGSSSTSASSSNGVSPPNPGTQSSSSSENTGANNNNQQKTTTAAPNQTSTAPSNSSKQSSTTTTTPVAPPPFLMKNPISQDGFSVYEIIGAIIAVILIAGGTLFVFVGRKSPP